MHISHVIDKNVCKMAKNRDLKTQIYGSKNISSCSIEHKIVNIAVYFVQPCYLHIYLKILMKMYEKIEYHAMN